MAPTLSRSASNRKLSDDQVRQVRALLRQGDQTNAAIGRQFGVSCHTIRAIKNGINYSNVVGG